jgi:hypothetical protein
MWKCINPICPCKDETCVSVKEPRNLNGPCKKAKMDGRDIHTVWVEKGGS